MASLVTNLNSLYVTGAENWKLGHDWRVVSVHDSTRQLSRVGVGGVYWIRN